MLFQNNMTKLTVYQVLKPIQLNQLRVLTVNLWMMQLVSLVTTLALVQDSINNLSNLPILVNF